MGTADGYVGACVQCRPGESQRGSGPVRQWGGLGKSREWTGGCEGLVCNCVDCSNRGTLPCPVDLGWPATTDFAVPTQQEGCLALPSRLTVLLVLPGLPGLLAHLPPVLLVRRVCRYLGRFADNQ